MKPPEQLEDVTIFMARLREIDRARLAELLNKKPVKKWYKRRWWCWRAPTTKDNTRLEATHTEDLPTFMSRLYEINRTRIIEPRVVKPKPKKKRFR